MEKVNGTWKTDFTGWKDMDLSPKGIEEAISAGKELKEKGFSFDVAYTSFFEKSK